MTVSPHSSSPKLFWTLIPILFIQKPEIKIKNNQSLGAEIAFNWLLKVPFFNPQKDAKNSNSAIKFQWHSQNAPERFHTLCRRLEIWFVSGSFSDYSGELNWQAGRSNMITLNILARVRNCIQGPFWQLLVHSQ